MNWINNIKGILCDLDGVVYTSKTPIEGSIEALRIINDKGIQIRFVTNTSGATPEMIQQHMQNMGITVEASQIFNPPFAAADYLKAQNYKTYLPIIRDSIKSCFDFLEEDDQNTDAIVVGDIGSKWDHKLMTTLFEHILNGADFVALHKGRFWKKKDHLQLDIGAFVHGLEYATNSEAKVMGKPSATFFELAQKSMGLSKDEVLMVGDDVLSDVGGAMNAKIRGVLVKTGKYNASFTAKSGVTPDLIVENLLDLASKL
ncbi:TIGR01458 family HAD-type hydrolase [Sediminitomix flava]|uniref:Haloacid dehalogenase-like hydrolase domain-containing protein 2 n=1 Tax=Sediminitomix flava TaxID=379075 RepID=A0A315Z6Y2_SEDFL|nr:TIGR01458 family HAD-type hydrolase [Sediminitomix flava]PWJ39982.1 HAD superfamily hydrolase (TIGR01458 family) [Sediminitomix flava]